MHGEFNCHWYENKGVVGIQMSVTDMTRIFWVFLNKKSIGLNLSLNHILQNSIVPEIIKKGLEFDLKQLKNWFIENCSIYKVSKLLRTWQTKCDGHDAIPKVAI